MIIDDIRKAYSFYSEQMFGEAKDFPLTTERDEAGGRYFEISPDGKMTLLARDRGTECYREETYSVDEFMYFIFCAYAFSIGFYEGPTDRPYEENRRIVVEEIGKLNPAWKLRYLKERAANDAANSNN
jgi:hypothetical protein